MRSRPNLRLAKLFAPSALMMLAGCASFVEPAPAPLIEPAPLPPAPADLVEPCPDPGVREGQPALTELARNRVALAVCRDRHGRLVAFHTDVRKGRAGATDGD